MTSELVTKWPTSEVDDDGAKLQKDYRVCTTAAFG